jgi:transposase
MEVPMKPYSKEMRGDILAACDAGEGTRAVALRFRVSESWVRRVKQERREQGKTAPCTTRNRIPQWAAYRGQIEELIAERPDMTLQELKDALGTSLSRQTLCTALQKLKLTLKKKS